MNKLVIKQIIKHTEKAIKTLEDKAEKGELTEDQQMALDQARIAIEKVKAMM